MTIQTITLADSNVRKTQAGMNLDELAASIAAHGLIQNLTVRPLLNETGGLTGRFAVIAGGRRLRALQRLAKDKTIKKTHPVPCRIIDTWSDTEIGLAENLYCPMHPADQYEAFVQLAAEGQSPADIAARFGVAEHTVQQRLKLGRVSPKLRDLYRDGAMKLDTLMAFTLTDDHAQQERVWAELPEWNRHASTVRRALTQAHVGAHVPIALFVGLDAYEQAGGRILRDLFDDTHTWLIDHAILDRLAKAKLDEAAEPIRAEGWKDVQVGLERPKGWQSGRVFATLREPTETEAEEAKKLEARLEEIEDAYQTGTEDEDGLLDEFDKIELRLAAIETQRQVYAEEDKARAAASVHIDAAGRLVITRGILLADGPPERGGSVTELDSSSHKRKDTGAAGDAPLSEALVQDLTACKTLGMRLALARQPDMALIALTHALASHVFHPSYAYGSCLDLRITEPYLVSPSGGFADTDASKAFEAERERWGEHLPGDAEGLWNWIVDADDDTRRELLAFCTATTLNTIVKAKGGIGGSPSRWTDHENRLAQAVRLDMSQHWQPTKDRYLGRVSKKRILADLADAGCPRKAEQIAKLKKDALIAAAEPLLTEAGWLPERLRTPSEPDAEDAADEPEPDTIAA